MAKTSTTQYARRELRSLGYEVEPLEHVVPYRFIKRDVFGFDLLAVKEDDILFIQVTTPSHVSARRHKISNIRGAVLLAGSGRVKCQIWGVRLGRLKAHQSRIIKHTL